MFAVDFVSVRSELSTALMRPMKLISVSRPYAESTKPIIRRFL
jgi:hypothetical protein